MLRHLEKSSKVNGQRLKIISWNPVKAGLVEEEPPRKEAGWEMWRSMQPVSQSRKAQTSLSLGPLIASQATHQIPKGKGSWKCNL